MASKLQKLLHDPLRQAFAHLASTVFLAFTVALAFGKELQRYKTKKWYLVPQTFCIFWYDVVLGLITHATSHGSNYPTGLDISSNVLSEELTGNPNALEGSPLSRRIYRKEVVSDDVKTYADFFGYDCEFHESATPDGFILPYHRIRTKQGNTRFTGRPIILQHGLFQGSGVYVTSGRNSLAFYLADRGFDVWLTNSRCVVKKNTTYKPHDREFWDWSLDDLAVDFKTFVDFIIEKTGSSKLIYCGHSQGTTTFFIGLNRFPEYAKKIHLFIGLAPAFYVSELIQWPLSYITHYSEQHFFTVFGVKEFIPIMCASHHFVPSGLFTVMAYKMFSFLFNWTDDNWEKKNKIKFFQFTPRPTSSKAIFHWIMCSRFGKIEPYNAEKKRFQEASKFLQPVLGRTTSADHENWTRLKSEIGKPTLKSSKSSEALALYHRATQATQTHFGKKDESARLRSSLSTEDNFFGQFFSTSSKDINENTELNSYELDKITCPTLLIYGDNDFLVKGRKLAEDMSKNPLCKLRGAIEIKDYQHLCPLWAKDAHEKVYSVIVRAIEDELNLK